MNSCLYECHVTHKRFEPRKHSFGYRIFMFCLDLDELDEAARKLPLFSHNRWNLYSFRDRDHLDLGQPTLKQNVVEYLRRNDVNFPGVGRVVLVTLPRVLGYIFNPVSFFYCYNTVGEPVAVIVEVGNTFGEQKPYLLLRKDDEGVFRLQTPKYFYVSPFSELDIDFDFKIRLPGERLEVRIDDIDEEGYRILCSVLNGKQRPLNNRWLFWLTLKYPFITLKVIFFIHWHALLLWLRRTPYNAKTANPEDQRDVLRPHESIADKTP